MFYVCVLGGGGGRGFTKIPNLKEKKYFLFSFFFRGGGGGGGEGGD